MVLSKSWSIWKYVWLSGTPGVLQEGVVGLRTGGLLQVVMLSPVTRKLEGFGIDFRLWGMFSWSVCIPESSHEGLGLVSQRFGGCTATVLRGDGNRMKLDGRDLPSCSLWFLFVCFFLYFYLFIFFSSPLYRNVLVGVFGVVP